MRNAHACLQMEATGSHIVSFIGLLSHSPRLGKRSSGFVTHWKDGVIVGMFSAKQRDEALAHSAGVVSSLQSVLQRFVLGSQTQSELARQAASVKVALQLRTHPFVTAFHWQSERASHDAAVVNPCTSQRVEHSRVPEFHWQTPACVRHVVSVDARLHALTQPPAVASQMHCESALQLVESVWLVPHLVWQLVPFHSQTDCCVQMSIALYWPQDGTQVRAEASHVQDESRSQVCSVKCASSQRWRQTAGDTVAIQRQSALLVHDVWP